MRRARCPCGGPRGGARPVRRRAVRRSGRQRGEQGAEQGAGRTERSTQPDAQPGAHQGADLGHLRPPGRGGVHPSNQSLPRHVQDASGAAADYADWHDDAILGSYVDRAGRVVVRARGTKAANAARTALAPYADVIDVRDDAPLSAAEASDEGDQLRASSARLSKVIRAWGPDPKHNGMFIVLNRVPTDRDRRLLETFAAAHAVPMSVEVAPGFTGGSPM